MDISSLALGLVRAHLAAYADDIRPIDRRTASSFLDGMCDAAHRLGFGMNPTGVRLATMDAVAAVGPRPHPNLSSRAGTAPARAWDDAATADLVARLDALRRVAN